MDQTYSPRATYQIHISASTDTFSAVAPKRTNRTSASSHRVHPRYRTAYVAYTYKRQTQCARETEMAREPCFSSLQVWAPLLLSPGSAKCNKTQTQTKSKPKACTDPSQILQAQQHNAIDAGARRVRAHARQSVVCKCGLRFYCHQVVPRVAKTQPQPKANQKQVRNRRRSYKRSRKRD